MNKLISSVLVLFVAGPAFAQEKPKAITVPFTLVETGHFLVKTKLNDKGPYTLIFDTGAPTMLINNRIAKDAGVKKGGGGIPFAMPFGAGGQVNIATLKVGDVEAKDVPAMVMDHPTVNVFSDYFREEFGPIDGIVGFPFFARYTMTVDYKAEEMTFEPNGYEPKDLMQEMMKGIQQSLMSGQGEAKPTVVGAAGYWGVTVDKAIADEEDGVDIVEVVSGSPAAKAGLKKGDRLLTLDHRWTDTEADAHAAASGVKPGKTVPVEVERGGEKMTLKVTPVEGI